MVIDAVGWLKENASSITRIDKMVFHKHHNLKGLHMVIGQVTEEGNVGTLTIVAGYQTAPSAINPWWIFLYSQTEGEGHQCGTQAAVRSTIKET